MDDEKAKAYRIDLGSDPDPDAAAGNLIKEFDGAVRDNLGRFLESYDLYLDGRLPYDQLPKAIVDKTRR